MTNTEEAILEMENEKHHLRVLEAKSILKRIRAFEDQIMEMRHRLSQLDDGAEPNTVDSFTGESFSRHKVVY